MDEQVQDNSQSSSVTKVTTADKQDISIEEQLEEARAEAEKNLNGWIRAQADFANFQKRKEAENKELVEFAREVAVAKLLPSLDSLEQALKHAPEIDGSVGASFSRPQSEETGGQGQPLQSDDFSQRYQTWLTGINSLVKQLDKALEELGVKKIEAVGQKFDPNFHEAVREVPGEEDNIVVEEYQTGFELNGKVIRPSQVAISKNNV